MGERYLEIGDGDPVTLRVDLLNSGTLRVSRVRMDITAPLGWDFVMIPDQIAILMPGERVSMTLALTPFVIVLVVVTIKSSRRLRCVGGCVMNACRIARRDVSCRIRPVGIANSCRHASVDKPPVRDEVGELR